ncbi:MAG: hypothetical protein HAW64_05735 [Alphaproteobacteria bacterium]|nr:hypothetical protein [Alphaproteobacteria bacterium]
MNLTKKEIPALYKEIVALHDKHLKKHKITLPQLKRGSDFSKDAKAARWKQKYNLK